MLAARVDSVIATSFDERGEPLNHATAKIGWSINSPALLRQRAKSRFRAMSSTEIKAGQIGAATVAVSTLITFAFAMTAVPPSGPYCPGDCMDYPFQALLRFYPRDYLWMYLGVPQLFSFVFFAVSLHSNTPGSKQVFSRTGVAIAAVSATVLLLAYWVQFTVVPASMMHGETDGLGLLSQYNGHGIFIAMEELGFVAMSVSLFFFSLAFAANSRLQKIIRICLALPAALTAISFVGYAVAFGEKRSYRFEVAAITINWLSLIILGILLSVHFRQVKSSTESRR